MSECAAFSDVGSDATWASSATPPTPAAGTPKKPARVRSSADSAPIETRMFTWSVVEMAVRMEDELAFHAKRLDEAEAKVDAIWRHLPLRPHGTSQPVALAVPDTLAKSPFSTLTLPLVTPVADAELAENRSGCDGSLELQLALVAARVDVMEENLQGLLAQMEALAHKDGIFRWQQEHQQRHSCSVAGAQQQPPLGSGTVCERLQRLLEPSASPIGALFAHVHEETSASAGDSVDELMPLFERCKDLPHGLSVQRFSRLLRELEGLNDSDLEQEVALVDRDGNGVIDAAEFEAWLDAEE